MRFIEDRKSLDVSLIFDMSECLQARPQPLGQEVIALLTLYRYGIDRTMFVSLVRDSGSI